MSADDLDQGGKHVIREYDGGHGCSTCPDVVRAVYLPERDQFFCVRELLADIDRLETCVTHIKDMVERAMPHAAGQGHVALMSVRSRLLQTLSGTYDTSKP